MSTPFETYLLRGALEFKRLNAPNLLIIGHGRHGKDLAAGMFQEEFGYTYESSSRSALRIFMFESLKAKYGYADMEKAYEDRVNHRAEWYDLICWYNREDPARLAKEIMATSNIYCGMRSNREIQRCIQDKVFDLIIWIDRSEHLPQEDRSSFDIDKSVAHIIIDNNGTKDQLRERIIALGKLF